MAKIFSELLGEFSGVICLKDPVLLGSALECSCDVLVLWFFFGPWSWDWASTSFRASGARAVALGHSARRRNLYLSQESEAVT